MSIRCLFDERFVIDFLTLQNGRDFHTGNKLFRLLMPFYDCFAHQKEVIVSIAAGV